MNKPEKKEWKLTKLDIELNGIINSCEAEIESQQMDIVKTRILEKKRNTELSQKLFQSLPTEEEIYVIITKTRFEILDTHQVKALDSDFAKAIHKRITQ